MNNKEVYIVMYYTCDDSCWDEYGCLDCCDYDLYKTLVDLGVNTKPVKEYSKVLGGGCTYKHRENIRKEFVKAIYYALPLVETFKDAEE